LLSVDSPTVTRPDYLGGEHDCGWWVVVECHASLLLRAVEAQRAGNVRARRLMSRTASKRPGLASGDRLDAPQCVLAGLARLARVSCARASPLPRVLAADSQQCLALTGSRPLRVLELLAPAWGILERAT
jgi:hypothetical protein